MLFLYNAILQFTYGDIGGLNWVSVLIIAFVTVQRGAEILWARRNTKLLLADGAFEVAGEHYPAMVGVHAAWLLSLWLLAPTREANLPLLAIFALLQFGRLWVLATLGRRWTTRIIVVPGTPLVKSGPYSFVRHPNYCIVTGEIFVLPLVFDLKWIAFAFTILNAIVLWIRIRRENAALDGGIRSSMGNGHA